MSSQEKIQLLQELSGLSQQELAQKMGVTFAALNRWVNNRAEPRPGMVAKIEAALAEHGVVDLVSPMGKVKRNVLLHKRKKLPKPLAQILKRRDIFDSFILALTYNSNRIEGSTFTEKDTAAVVFDGVTLPRKTLVEHLEAKNHAAALEFLFAYLGDGGVVNETLVKKLHSILMNAIYPDAGLYRRHGVRIVGSRTITANYLKVPDLMKALFKQAQSKSVNTFYDITKFHAEFEKIHPFADGNGRVGRLILTAMLLKDNFPPAIVSQRRKREYYAALEKAQTKENYAALEEFICDSINGGYKIFEV